MRCHKISVTTLLFVKMIMIHHKWFCTAWHEYTLTCTMNRELICEHFVKTFGYLNFNTYLSYEEWNWSFSVCTKYFIYRKKTLVGHVLVVKCQRVHTFIVYYLYFTGRSNLSSLKDNFFPHSDLWIFSVTMAPQLGYWDIQGVSSYFFVSL